MKNVFSKTICLALALALVLCSVPLSARAVEVREIESGVTGAEKLPAWDIAQLIRTGSLGSTGSFVDVQPNYESPWSAGSVKQEHLQSALDRLNALRALAGLPAVELDEDYTASAQAAAYLSAANNALSHTPEKPDGMDDALYQKGFDGASSSNIAMASGYPDRGPLSYSVDLWMEDSDASNVDRLGHRRWQLNPTMDKTGFGAAPAKSGSGFFSAEYVFGRGGDSPDYDVIAWPASGWFPACEDLFAPNFAWSVTLNPDKYASLVPADITVTLSRESDGSTWTFKGSDYSPSNSEEYFNVDTANYGVNNCIIFRPGGVEAYEGRYTVTVAGVRYKSGAAADFKYTVEFFDPEDLPPDPSMPFTDVAAGDWFYPYVRAGSEAGLIKGTGDTTFEPNTRLTLAQVVTFAARTAARARGDTDPTVNDWKAGSYDYCVVNGIIVEADYPFASLDDEATRYDLVRIMDPAIPESAMEEKVDVPSGSIPDVEETDELGEIIYRWYRAGILEGTGDGSFDGDEPMVRSAMAAILCRMNGIA